jgi:hypothetical protein
MLIQLQKKHSGSQKYIWSHINPFRVSAPNAPILTRL